MIGTRLLLIVAGACAVALLAGCYDTFVDARYDEDGEVILEDTEKNWGYFAESVDRDVIREAREGRPGAGKETWLEFWNWRIRNISENRENRDRYVSYILEQRRTAGLPELDELAEPEQAGATNSGYEAE